MSQNIQAPQAFTEYSIWERRDLDSRNTIIVRILWLMIISMSLGTCGFLIWKTYRKWDTTPVIISFAHGPMPVWKIPFPAVTICPESKFLQTVYNYSSYFKQHTNNKENITDSDMKRLAYASLLCERILGDLQSITDENVFQFMVETSPRREDLFIDNQFNKEHIRRMFTPVITEEGICYSFNILNGNDIFNSEVYYSANFFNHEHNVTDWSVDEGYTKAISKGNYPRRSLSAGIESGATFILMTYIKDVDYLCKGPINGFKLLLHHPGEIPQPSIQFFRIPFNEDVTFSLKPEVVKTSNTLRNYDPQKRGCYFAGEKQLRYYKIYTQQNCQLECLTNYTLKLCQCVSFYMPRTNATKLCGSGRKHCVQDAREEILTAHALNEDNKNKVEADCNCLPSCSMLMYSAETSQSNFEWQMFVKVLSNDDHQSERLSRVTISFKDMQFMTSERNELYGITDFLANCGGLLGLFIGFSLLSLVETLYFLTVRLCINWKKYGRHYWSASDDVLQNKNYGREKQGV